MPKTRKPDIALIGRARTGKDTVAKYLVENHGYMRVAFADALKDMALEVDPLLTIDEPTLAELHLSEAVEQFGWENSKDWFPEVRRFLQNLGVAVRDRDPEFWINSAEGKLYEAAVTGQPAVVTDVRFLNEVAYLEEVGFTTVSVTRPCRITEGLDAVDTHVSETELANYPTDRDICNAGSIADLEADVQKILLSR